MMKDEKNPHKQWEFVDPKPPVVQSGHREGHRQNQLH